MPTRFVILANAKPSDKPYAPRRQITWQQIADEAGAAIANLGDQWCTDYGIDGLGLASPRETLAERAAREAADEAAGANKRTVEQRLDAFLNPDGPVKQYLAIASPTAAQTAAQTKRLTRAVIALVRMQRNALDVIDDTNGT